MTKKAPAGSRQAAKDVLKLRQTHGAKEAARMLDVSPSTVYRISNTAKKRTAVGKVIASPRSLEKWRSRITEGQRKSTTAQLKQFEDLKPSAIAKSLSKAGVDTSYQQVTWWKRKAGVGKPWTRRKDKIKPLSSFEARLLSEIIPEIGYTVLDGVEVYLFREMIPEKGIDRANIFGSVQDAVNWVNKIGVGSGKFIVFRFPQREGKPDTFGTVYIEEEFLELSEEEEDKVLNDISSAE